MHNICRQASSSKSTTTCQISIIPPDQLLQIMEFPSIRLKQLCFSTLTSFISLGDPGFDAQLSSAAVAAMWRLSLELLLSESVLKQKVYRHASVLLAPSAGTSRCQGSSRVLVLCFQAVAFAGRSLARVQLVRMERLFG